MKSIERLNLLVQEDFDKHPLADGVTRRNAEVLLANYLAMSQAFPYIQAGSQSNLILDIMEKNLDVPSDIEMTSVVGNFISWDETGGHSIMMKTGIEGLSGILDTQKLFHSNLLKQDIMLILGKPIRPSYSKITKEYLKNLLKGFSSFDRLERLAYMVAFEYHAGQMIEALWNSLSAQFNIAMDELSYFKTHVGGNDPSEPYHIKMTCSMIESFVRSDSELDTFLQLFREAYSTNVRWCQKIKF